MPTCGSRGDLASVMPPYSGLAERCCCGFRVDAAVVAEDTIPPRAARDPVVAPAADQVVVLRVTEQRRRCRPCRKPNRRRREPRRAADLHRWRHMSNSGGVRRSPTDRARTGPPTVSPDRPACSRAASTARTMTRRPPRSNAVGLVVQLNVDGRRLQPDSRSPPRLAGRSSRRCPGRCSTVVTGERVRSSRVWRSAVVAKSTTAADPMRRSRPVRSDVIAPGESFTSGSIHSGHRGRSGPWSRLNSSELPPMMSSWPRLPNDRRRCRRPPSM